MFVAAFITLLGETNSMSAVLTAFNGAVKKSDWSVAYNNFRILNMTEMCLGLHGIGEIKREAFWNERQKNLRYPVEMERWEYAYTVVRFKVLPANPPNSGQEQEASDFLKTVVKRKATKLEQNLGFSMQAVNHVLTRNNIKGANWDLYTPITKTQSYEYNLRKAREATDPAEKARYTALADSHKNATDVCLYEVVRPESDAEIDAAVKSKAATTTIDLYRIIAAKAKKNGCGNCGENSVVAFMFLYDMGVRPLDRMTAHADHEFVVIGRKAGPVNDWKKWGPEAVVCDPWAQGWRDGQNSNGTYAGTRYESVMTGLLGDIKIDDFYRAE